MPLHSLAVSLRFCMRAYEPYCVVAGVSDWTYALRMGQGTPGSRGAWPANVCYVLRRRRKLFDDMDLQVIPGMAVIAASCRPSLDVYCRRREVGGALRVAGTASEYPRRTARTLSLLISCSGGSHATRSARKLPWMCMPAVAKDALVVDPAGIISSIERPATSSNLEEALIRKPSMTGLICCVVLNRVPLSRCSGVVC
jgi:hypothetical protein